MTAFTIIITRACCINGAPVAPGARVEVTAATAQGLIDCGHVLADDDDLPALRQAQADEFAALAASAPVFGQAPEAAAEQLADAVRELRPRPRIGFLP